MNVHHTMSDSRIFKIHVEALALVSLLNRPSISHDL